MKHILKTEDIDIMFITETDTKYIEKESDYKIEGYKTVLPLVNGNNALIRIICLLIDEVCNKVKIRQDLMNKDFPSIWLELESAGCKKSQIIAGFYRVWTHEGCADNP